MAGAVYGRAGAAEAGAAAPPDAPPDADAPPEAAHSDGRAGPVGDTDAAIEGVIGKNAFCCLSLCVAGPVTPSLNGKVPAVALRMVRGEAWLPTRKELAARWSRATKLSWRRKRLCMAL